MPTIVIQYPLDLTGTAPGNFVTGEVHDLASVTNRAIVPNHGPFFTRGMAVRSLTTGHTLVPETQFKAVQLFPEATLKTGLEVCTVILIVDETEGNQFAIDYHVLGGDYSASVYAIQQLIDSLEIDQRAVRWGQVLGKPEGFPAAPHLHDLGDLYGFEYIVAALESVRQAILTGDNASHTEIYQYIDYQDQVIRNSVSGFQTALNAHITDYGNPHQVTKTQVGLSNVQNYAIATQAEAQAGVINTAYMTPLRTKEAIAQQAGNMLSAHVNDHNNPHVVTAAQVGLGSVDNFPTASQAEAEAGTAADRFMTPLRTKQAITVLALNPLNAHLSDFNNPHQVTKTQIGLSLVANYAVASTAEAQAGVATDKYMTPALVKAAINAQASTALTAHLSDYGNPHQVTKAQVGLGSVLNYGVADQATAEAGSSNTTYMTPLRTAQEIAAKVGNAFTSHLSNFNNPHQVTQDQVGLGNVGNYLMATAAQAQAGVAQDRYMSPYLVRAAIEALGGGKWTITGDENWGCARENQSGLTIQWGTSSTILVGRAQILYYRRKWSGSGPMALIPNAIGAVNANDVGEWAARSPFFATWFRDAASLALPSGTVLPPDTDAAFIGFGRHGSSTSNSGQCAYVAIGITTVDSLQTGLPTAGRGTNVAPYTPAGPTTVTLSPASVNNTRSVTTSTATVYSDWVIPTMGGGDGSYTVAWSIINAGGRSGDISIGRSGNSARLVFNAKNMSVVGNTDQVTATLRCSATSLGDTATKDVVITLQAKRVYAVSEPTNLDFELGDTGWIKTGAAAISSGSAYGGNWKARITYNDGNTSGIYANGGRACTPGSTVTVACQVHAYNAADQVGGHIRLIFMDANGNPLVTTYPGNDINVAGGSTWRISSVSQVVPAGAAYYTVQGEAYVVVSSGIVDFDNFTLNYVPPTGGGGGGGGDGTCVAVDMYMDETRLAGDIQVGDWIDGSTYNPDGIELRQVNCNDRAMQPCYLMTTVSGIQLVASDSTPMTMRDGDIGLFNPMMVNEDVLVDDQGDIRWEAVVSMEYLGLREVVLFDVDDQSYFAGVVGNRRIATHNLLNQK